MINYCVNVSCMLYKAPLWSWQNRKIETLIFLVFVECFLTFDRWPWKLDAIKLCQSRPQIYGVVLQFVENIFISANKNLHPSVDMYGLFQSQTHIPQLSLTVCDLFRSVSLDDLVGFVFCFLWSVSWIAETPYSFLLGYHCVVVSFPDPQSAWWSWNETTCIIADTVWLQNTPMWNSASVQCYN